MLPESDAESALTLMLKQRLYPVLCGEESGNGGPTVDPMGGLVSKRTQKFEPHSLRIG